MDMYTERIGERIGDCDHNDAAHYGKLGVGPGAESDDKPQSCDYAGSESEADA